MVKEDKNSIEIIEQGDIFFFYRPKVDTKKLKTLRMSRDFIWLLHQRRRRRKRRMTSTDYF
jgi:hypothetical protein